MTPVTILFCTDSLMAGGTEHQLITHISHLSREKFAPYVVCLYGERAGRSLHFLEALQMLDVPVFQLDLMWNLWDKLYAVRRLTEIIRQIRPHIVQAVNYHSNLLLRAVCPWFSASTCLIGCIYIEYTRKQILYEYLTGWLCSAVVCNSLPIQQSLPKYLTPLLITNGVDIERFSHNPDITLRSRLSPHATKVLLVIGRISRQKSPYALLEAVAILKQRSRLPSDLAVWFVGEAQDKDVYKQLADGIRFHNLENIVSLFPATTCPEAYYHAADIVVLPSLREGLPNVALEALAAGKPLVISKAANTSGIVQHGYNGWIVKTQDSESFALDLQRILDMDLGGLRSNCQTSAQPFSLLKMVQDYGILYERLSARS